MYSTAAMLTHSAARWKGVEGMPYHNGKQLSYYDSQLVQYARNGNHCDFPMLCRFNMVRTEFLRERGRDKRVPVYTPNWDRIWEWLRDDLPCPSRNMTLREAGSGAGLRGG